MRTPPFIGELLKNGKLASFEPSLKGLEIGQSDSDEVYERYEFSVQIENFILMDNLDSSTLFFYLQADRCQIFIMYLGENEDKILSASDKMFEILGIEEIREGSHIYLSWQEADDIITRYIRYMKNPEIPSVPQ